MAIGAFWSQPTTHAYLQQQAGPEVDDLKTT